MFQKLLTLFLSLNLLISSTSLSAKPTPVTQTTPRKQKLVLMPIIVSSEDMRLRGQMETALVEGLQEKYVVFSGDNVLQKQREAFAKESREAKGDCDQTKCMQNIAESFASELVAVAHVTKQDGGYFLSLNIQNIFDEKVVYTKSLAYKNSDAFEVIEKLKELAGTKPAVNNTPIVPTTIDPAIEQKPVIQNTTNNEESTLWNEIQSTNTIDDYTIYLDTYPKGKYLTLAKARIKKLQDDAITKANEQAQTQEQQSWDTAQSTNTQASYNQYLANYPNGKFVALAKVKVNKIKADIALKDKEIADKAAQEAISGVFYDKSTGLTWQDNEEAKTVMKNWQGAIDYCENLTLAGESDWRLPTKEELISLSTLGFYGNLGGYYAWEAWNDVNKHKQVNGLYSNPSLKYTSSHYWCSSFDFFGSANACFVNFYWGIASKPDGEHFNIRCVRNSK